MNIAEILHCSLVTRTNIVEISAVEIVAVDVGDGEKQKGRDGHC